MKNRSIKETGRILSEEYSDDISDRIVDRASDKFDELMRSAGPGDSHIRKFRTEDIFPLISLYEAMMEEGIGGNEACDFLDRAWSRRAEPKARSMRMLLKLPGSYRLMPSIFRKVTLQQFGEDAGFHAEFYETGKDECRFDMTKCLYCDEFKGYGHPELTKCMCHTDDVTNGSMHPKICWHRTKIMGDGDSCCDFHLYIKE